MNGFVNVLKPVGATASDVVVCVRHILHEKKVGHLGTLDPGASGVLPVAVGQATRLFDYLTNKIKYYRAFFTFGKTTDTLDAYGTVTATSEIVPDAEQIAAVLPEFLGETDQIPPVYSAISVGGVRCYDLARQGVAVEMKSRKITVYSYNLVRQMSPDTFVLDIKCSGGTYIRSLANDLAARLGTVGYMSGLIRLSSGCFDIAQSYTLDEVRQLGEKCLLPVDYPLSDVPTVNFADDLYNDIDCARFVKAPHVDDYFKVVCKGVLFGLGHSEHGKLKIDYYLKNAF